MENTQLINISDFVELGEELRNNRKYLEVVKLLESQGKKRIILDREAKSPYLIRYYYLNFRPFARITIHNILRSDIDGLHDHPWPFQTYILAGGYWENTPGGRFWRGPGYNGISLATDFHRLEIDSDKAGEETWSLFLMGPKEKEWGFLDDGKWVQWKEYLERRKKSLEN